MILQEISFDLARISAFSVTVSIVGYVIVFAALIFLTLIYSSLPKFLNMKLRQKLKRQGKHQNSVSDDLNIPGEVTAAISLALIHFFDESHDIESKVMTIKQVSKRYSPWSSKIYGLNTYRK